MYQGFGNSPLNYGDPLGLACTTEHGGTNQLCNPMDEMQLSSATPWWQYAWAVAAETGGNTLTEGLFLNVFADAPHVVTDPEASTGEKVMAGGKATGAAVLNLGGAGVVVKAGLGRLAATRPVQWAAQRLSRSRLGQRVTGVLMEDVGVLWRRAFGQADEVVEEAGERLLPRTATAGARRFVDGDLFETAIHSDAGTVRVLAETSVSGRALTLSDLVVYADDGTLVNQVGARQFLTLRTQVAREAAEAGFDTLRITGVRVPTSSSANPGMTIDRLIDLSRLK